MSQSASLGSTWSAWWGGLAPQIQRCINDILFVGGPRHIQMFLEGGAIARSMVIAGYPGDYYLNDYMSEAAILRSKWNKKYGKKNIICFYDNVFAKDDENDFHDTISYINNLFSWTIKESNSLLVIKAKTEKSFDDYQSTYLA